MKFNSILTAVCLAALAGGCGKKEEMAAPPATEQTKMTNETVAEAQKAVSAVADNAKQTATNAATEAKQAAEKSIETVTKPAETGTTSQAQGLIDRVKILIAEKKYQEALTSLSQASGLQLTPEQQSQVTSLKEQLQKLMAGNAASDAAKSVGGFLEKK